MVNYMVDMNSKVSVRVVVEVGFFSKKYRSRWFFWFYFDLFPDLKVTVGTRAVVSATLLSSM